MADRRHTPWAPGLAADGLLPTDVNPSGSPCVEGDGCPAGCTGRGAWLDPEACPFLRRAKVLEGGTAHA